MVGDEVIPTLGDRYVLRKAHPEDALTLMYDIRDADALEWLGSVKGDVAHNLFTSIYQSEECYTVVSKQDGCAHIIFGVVAGHDVTGTTWLIGTNQGQADCYWILQQCREFYEAFFKRWPKTICYSSPQNTVHHRWLEWMGYRHNRTIPWGSYNLPFYEFVKGGT